MIAKIETMLKMQDATNTQTIGADWKTRPNEEINWGRAIYMECAELIDHLGWKWWKKKGPVDMDQARLEVVDIAHFVFSFALRGIKGSSLEGRGIPDYIQAKFDFETTAEGIEASRSPVYCADGLLHVSSYKTLHLLELGLQDLIRVFVKLCHSMGMTLDDLYRLYIAKNALNKFRQDHGYKEGTYHKMWPTPITPLNPLDVHNMNPVLVEDNTALMLLLDEVDLSNLDYFDYVYKELEAYYLKCGLTNTTATYSAVHV